LKAIVQDEDPEGSLGRKQGRDETAEKEIEDRVKSQRAGRVKWALFSTVLNFARKYIVFRENQRFNLDRWITMNRKLYLAVGRNFQNREILSEPSDIFFLRKNEIRGIADGKFNSRETEKTKRLVEERKAEFLRDENVTPPKFLQGDCEFDDPAQSYKTELSGIPASQGVLTGLVRVLDRIDDIWRVRTGEILVVPRTDPGWTPVFGKIGGLITETGGLLSHGAVVSREYRIPAVTNIPNACRIFKTGQTVTIDGSKGIVRIN
jgi:phosphohistidine swiveling domain-containing protein